MIRIEGETLSVRLGSDAGGPELTGKMLPCPTPDCPCGLVFLILAPRDRPQEQRPYALNVERRVAERLQGEGSGASFRTAQDIAARLSDEHWDALARLLRDGKATGAAKAAAVGADAGVVLVSGTWPIARNAPCPCGSRKKYKRCCGSDAEALPPWFVSG